MVQGGERILLYHDIYVVGVVVNLRAEAHGTGEGEILLYHDIHVVGV